MSERQKPPEEVGSWVPERAALPVELDALRIAIATLAPEIGQLAHLLEASPRTAWPAICAAARTAKGWQP